MTPELALVGDHPKQDSSSLAWEQFLENALEDSWRPQEWDASTFTFTGDPLNPRTAVSYCRTKSCPSIIDGSSLGFCQACRRRRSAWDAADGDFESTYSPRFRKSSAAPYSFTLAGLTPSLRNEIVYGLQQRDADSMALRPNAVAAMVRQFRDAQSVLDASGSGKGLHFSYLRSVQSHVRRLRAAHAGRDGTEGEVWDCALVGLFSARDRKYRAVKGHLDFTPIRQGWLRQLALEWARATRPSVADARQVIHAAEIASLALAGRPSGDAPELLGMADMAAIFDALAHARKPRSGAPYSLSHRHGLIGRWRRLIQFGRSAGQMDEVPGNFALLPEQKLLSVKQQEGELGRAIPEEWIAHLDNHLSEVGASSTFSNNGWTCDDYAAQYRTIYQLIRDTGRRPSEILSLPRSPVEHHDGNPSLVYDNHKAGRLGRRLPIDPSTAAIVAEWETRLQRLPVPVECTSFLFPAPGARNRERRGHMRAGQFSRVFRTWVRGVEAPTTLSPDAQRFDREDIEPYGLRHAYAQRHADNGTPVDVLKELMDHVDIATTMGYYKVSLKRKQDAVRLLAKYSLDRHGNPAPFASPIAYQRSTVAVPFGNCTEPKNVQAGGKACPIRFQCAGCGFFRPDPSYLAAIDGHVAQLRVDRELAIGSDAAEWVVTNLDEQISAFSEIASGLRSMVSGLDADERNRIDDASAVMCRDRSARTFIPLDSIGRRPADD